MLLCLHTSIYLLSSSSLPIAYTILIHSLIIFPVAYRNSILFSLLSP